MYQLSDLIFGNWNTHAISFISIIITCHTEPRDLVSILISSISACQHVLLFSITNEEQREEVDSSVSNMWSNFQPYWRLLQTFMCIIQTVYDWLQHLVEIPTVYAFGRRSGVCLEC